MDWSNCTKKLEQSYNNKKASHSKSEAAGMFYFLSGLIIICLKELKEISLYVIL